MLNQDVRRSHLTNFFDVIVITEEEIYQRRKRLQEENNPSLDVFVETLSTDILVEESITVKMNFLSPETHNQKPNNQQLLTTVRKSNK